MGITYTCMWIKDHAIYLFLLLLLLVEIIGWCSCENMKVKFQCIVVAKLVFLEFARTNCLFVWITLLVFCFVLFCREVGFYLLLFVCLFLFLWDDNETRSYNFILSYCSLFTTKRLKINNGTIKRVCIQVQRVLLWCKYFSRARSFSGEFWNQRQWHIYSYLSQIR